MYCWCRFSDTAVCLILFSGRCVFCLCPRIQLSRWSLCVWCPYHPKFWWILLVVLNGGMCLAERRAVYVRLRGCRHADGKKANCKHYRRHEIYLHGLFFSLIHTILPVVHALIYLGYWVCICNENTSHIGCGCIPGDPYSNANMIFISQLYLNTNMYSNCMLL